MSFDLSRAASVRLEVKSEVEESLVVSDLGARPEGHSRLLWEPPPGLAPGIYRFLIHAVTPEGERFTFPSGPAPGGDEVMAGQFQVDSESGAFEFVLPQASRVRLRVGLKGYPLLRTLLDWEPMLAGRHKLDWDGLDASGLIRLHGHDQLSLNLSAYSLPDQVFVLRSADGKGMRRTGRYPGGIYRHSVDSALNCREPRFRIEFPGAARDPENVPVLSGAAPVRIVLSDADAAHLIGTRFEVMYFVDTVFLFEREEGSNPYTFELDTSHLYPGPHLLTVNVIGYDDHIGATTVPFIKEGGA